MAKHFISVLGASIYEPVVYQSDTYKNNKEYEYVQLAVIDQYKEELQEAGSKITIFVTDFSKQKNYDDRVYTDNDEKRTSKWRNPVKAGEEKAGFKTQFGKCFPELEENFECIIIRDGKNNQEIWEIFDAMFHCLNEGDEIIFDITHAFRSIPMLAMTVINYAKVLKNCNLYAITYGAYDPGSKGGEDKKIVPLLDLSIYSEILDWTQASTVFMRYGNASMLKEVYDNHIKKIPNEKKKEWSGIGKMVDASVLLSDDIQTGRGVESACIQKKMKNTTKHKISIKDAYHYFKSIDISSAGNVLESMPPLVPLYEKMKSNYSIFDKDENYDVGFAVVKWCIDNAMIQQGYTALEESAKTFLCYYYDLDQLDEICRDKIAGRCAVWKAKWLIDNKEKDTAEKCEESFSKYIYSTGFTGFDMLDEEQKQICCQIVKTLPGDFAKEIKNIKDKRNDINHFGMRDGPMDAHTLSKDLAKHYNSVQEVVNKMLEQRI